MEYERGGEGSCVGAEGRVSTEKAFRRGKRIAWLSLFSLCLPLLGDEAGRSAKYGQRKCGPMWAERLESGKTEGKSLPADSSSTCHLY